MCHYIAHYRSQLTSVDVGRDVFCFTIIPITMSAYSEPEQADELIKSVFHHDSFRSELQKQATETVLKGERWIMDNDLNQLPERVQTCFLVYGLYHIK